jgi:hypothetical protein
MADDDENRAGLLLKKPRSCRGSVIRHAMFDRWNDGFGGSARLVGAGRDCADAASAGCVVAAVFEAPASIARLNDIALIEQVVILASPNTLGHSPNAKMVVTTIDVRSFSLRTRQLNLHPVHQGIVVRFLARANVRFAPGAAIP